MQTTRPGKGGKGATAREERRQVPFGRVALVAKTALASYGAPFGPGQTVTVYLNNLNSNCGAFKIGSFTTT
jgi:hypothetical protein